MIIERESVHLSPTQVYRPEDAAVLFAIHPTADLFEADHQQSRRIQLVRSWIYQYVSLCEDSGLHLCRNTQ